VGQLAAGVVDLLGQALVTAGSGALRHCLQAECQRDQALLPAVVEIALDVPASLVLCGHDAFGRRLKFGCLPGNLVEALLQLEAETHVVQNEASLRDQGRGEASPQAASALRRAPVAAATAGAAEAS
jgi:hypothetical protein